MLGIPKTVPGQDDLERDLRAAVSGEVRVDPVSRGLYATDASIYQISPLAVIVPNNRADALAALEVARRRGLRVLPRGGGTSLAGQTVGESIVIDFSVRMNRVLEVNEPERWVRVEPGLVRDELNAKLAGTGLHFAPETATANRANVGGMIGNNSSGTRSILYGKTVDHVLELEVALVTGEVLRLRPMPRAEWDEVARRGDAEGRIYKTVARLVDEHREEIRARYPKVMRRVGGYNLDEFIDAEKDWNLAKLVVGSEGTLAMTLSAKLNLEPPPAAKGLCVVHFKQVIDGLRSTSTINRHGPSMVELLDHTILGLAKKNIETKRYCEWVQGDPAMVLVIEFFGDSRADVEGKIDALTAELKAAKYGYAHLKMLDAGPQADVMNVRMKGLGLMLGMKGDAKPIPFIEDAAVPVEVLPEYIDAVLNMLREMGVPVAMYAHASVGLIHVRPILNLKRVEDIETMKRISEATFELVRKFGGSWSGEHGDGLVRSYMNERFFGPKIYGAFREIKAAFDPPGLMNPGKIVDAPPMDENLRYGPQYRKMAFPTQFFYREDGGFDKAVELCTGVGECRKTLGGVMCPSYRATRDEKDSTRGRANALRLAMTGQLGLQGLALEGVKDTLDLCLSCKACKSECPSNVDMAKLKAEFMSLYHDSHGATLGERFFAAAPQMAARFSGKLAPLANRIGKIPAARALMEKTLGVDRRRPLPEFAEQTFADWFDARRGGARAPRDGRRVAIFNDTFMNHHEPSIGRAAVAVLERLGYRVEVANAGCCQRTLISTGFLREARLHGAMTLRRLNNIVMEEVPVVVFEPSCMSALVDDLPDLIENVQLGRRVQQGVFMIETFLERELADGRIRAEDLAAAREEKNAGVLIHGHCHQKALFGTGAQIKILGAACGAANVSEIPSGCCGMAGQFGYDKERYDVSMAIGEDRLFPAVRAMEPGARLVASGFSCRHQIADGCGVRPKHFIEALAEAMGVDSTQPAREGAAR